jgi:hypothetical protein
MSYAEFCLDQASDCARRARLARSTQIAAYYQDLAWRWLRLAEQAQETGGALGNRGELEALCPPRLHTAAVAKPQAANANGSLFRLRFREKVGLHHFKKIAKHPARLFIFWVRRRGPERTPLPSSLRSSTAFRE